MKQEWFQNLVITPVHIFGPPKIFLCVCVCVFLWECIYNHTYKWVHTQQPIFKYPFFHLIEFYKYFPYVRGGGETVKYPPNQESSLRPRNKAGHSIQFTQSFIQSISLQEGIRQRMLHGSHIVILCKIQTFIHRFYRVREHAEGDRSETKAFPCP